MKNYPGPLYAPWSAVVKGRGFDPVEKRMEKNEPQIKGDWRTASHKCIAENQLDNIASLMNGKWYATETLNSRGERTKRYIVEFPHPDYPDAGGSVSGND